jgi:hypothetical protein
MASRRQCQTSVFAFEAVAPALFLGSLLLACRRGDPVGTTLALASCQRGFSTLLIVSGRSGGISAGVIAGAGGKLASVSTRALGSGSRSDFVNSFGTAAGSTLLSSAVDATTGVANGPAVLIAIAAPRPTKQKRPNQVVLVIRNAMAPAVWRRLGANLQDRIRAGLCGPAWCLAMFLIVSTRISDSRTIGLIWDNQSCAASFSGCCWRH